MSDFNWSNGDIFVVAPREMSVRRFTQIVKRYLPKGNIVFGISKEPYVVGFEGQPQFRMLERSVIQPVIDAIEKAGVAHKVQVLEYSQHDLSSIAAQLTVAQRVLLVNGSWKYAFHNSDAYKLFAANNVKMKYISPFTDEDEAKVYAGTHQLLVELPHRGKLLSAQQMFEAADKASLQSYDYCFQTGVALGKKHDGSYEMITTAYNEVIPYPTYALHHGNSREKHQSPPHDANHYDTIHAEMELLVEAARGDYSLDGTSLFINLLPCPNCARTLSQTGIDEVIYRNDHSSGYAKELLELCGKKVKRITE